MKKQLARRIKILILSVGLLLIVAACVIRPSPQPILISPSNKLATMVPTDKNPISATITPKPSASQTHAPLPSLTPTSFPPILNGEFTSFTNANFIRALLVDRQGDLWTGGVGGVVHWSLKKNTYTKYTSEHGLAGNFVTAIVQTTDGSMWFGTYGSGVSQFDGANWITYTDYDGLPDNQVLSLAVAPDGAVWAGSLEGVARYDGQVWSPINPNGSSETPIKHVDAIAIANDGTIWIGGDWKTGLWKIKDQNIQNFSQALGTDEVTALSIAPDGSLWIGTHYGVVHYDGNTWKQFELTSNELIAISSIAIGEDGSVWVGFSVWMGYSKYSLPEEMREEVAKLSDHFTGVMRYDGKTWQVISHSDGLVDNEIRALAVDKDGNVWFGSYQQGVSRYNGQGWTKFQTKDGLLTNRVSTVGISNNGELWIGHTTGLSHYDGRSWNIYTHIENMEIDNVFAIDVDPDGEIWLGAFEGIAHFDGALWITYQKEQLDWFNGVFDIITLKDGTHLFAGGGVAIFDGKGWTTISELSQTFRVRAAQAPDGSLWFASLMNGIYHYDGKIFKHYTEADGLINDFVNDLTIVPNGDVWVTSCYGISKFDGKKWITVEKEDVRGDGLPVNCNSKSITYDDFGVVWIATYEGILRIEEGKKNILTTHDGLASNTINDIVVGPDDAIWIATDAGLSRYVTINK